MRTVGLFAASRPGRSVPAGARAAHAALTLSAPARLPLARGASQWNHGAPRPPCQAARRAAEKRGRRRGSKAGISPEAALAGLARSSSPELHVFRPAVALIPDRSRRSLARLRHSGCRQPHGRAHLRFEHPRFPKHSTTEPSLMSPRCGRCANGDSCWVSGVGSTSPATHFRGFVSGHRIFNRESTPRREHHPVACASRLHPSPTHGQRLTLRSEYRFASMHLELRLTYGCET